jgi:hypothetical protein
MQFAGDRFPENFCESAKGAGFMHFDHEPFPDILSAASALPFADRLRFVAGHYANMA